jgi:PKD repeat protein
MKTKCTFLSLISLSIFLILFAGCKKDEATDPNDPNNPDTKKAPVADFSANITSFTLDSLNSFTLVLTDKSTNTPSKLEYKVINDLSGKEISQFNGGYTIDSAGTYSVTLKATNDYGSNEITKKALVTVIDERVRIYGTIKTASKIKNYDIIIYFDGKSQFALGNQKLLKYITYLPKKYLRKTNVKIFFTIFAENTDPFYQFDVSFGPMTLEKENEININSPN